MIEVDFKVRCQDCGLPYEGPDWVEVILPNDIFAKISGNGGNGLWCHRCLDRRAAALGIKCDNAKICWIGEAISGDNWDAR